MIDYDATRKVLSMLTNESAAHVMMTMKDQGPARSACVICGEVEITHTDGSTQLVRTYDDGEKLETLIPSTHALANIDRSRVNELPSVLCYVTRSVRSHPYLVKASMRVVQRQRDGMLIWRTDALGYTSAQRILAAGTRAGTKAAKCITDTLPASLHNKPVA